MANGKKAALIIGGITDEAVEAKVKSAIEAAERDARAAAKKELGEVKSIALYLLPQIRKLRGKSVKKCVLDDEERLAQAVLEMAKGVVALRK